MSEMSTLSEDEVIKPFSPQERDQMQGVFVHVNQTLTFDILHKIGQQIWGAPVDINTLPFEDQERLAVQVAELFRVFPPAVIVQFADIPPQQIKADAERFSKNK